MYDRDLARLYLKNDVMRYVRRLSQEFDAPLSMEQTERFIADNFVFDSSLGRWRLTAPYDFLEAIVLKYGD